MLPAPIMTPTRRCRRHCLQQRPLSLFHRLLFSDHCLLLPLHYPLAFALLLCLSLRLHSLSTRVQLLLQQSSHRSRHPYAPPPSLSLHITFATRIPIRQLLPRSDLAYRNALHYPLSSHSQRLRSTTLPRCHCRSMTPNISSTSLKTHQLIL